MTPADKIAALDARTRFALEVLQREEAIDLGRAALLVAAEEDARCDVGRSLEVLEALGAEARARVERGEGSRVEALNRYLFDELGFVGNQTDYYDPRNSLLHHVLERRTGIPITLSLVYMEVGRRAGMTVEGVGMPGHFIVRACVGEPDVALVDPFHGQTVDEDDCQQRLDIIYGGQVPLTAEHLRPVGTREILVRLLANLKAIYSQTQLYRRALAVVERILLLAPQSFGERRDRGILLAQLDRLPEAIAELRSYLNFAENAPDSEAVREQLKKMQVRLAMLN
ncbi:MAG TPA: transglutaminase-like domain-containing protein [Pyrinomonadaceae bacterium]|nr:transglutaminase-like domain-containing protein [Pyrinomonadaceae bacterium]